MTARLEGRGDFVDRPCGQCSQPLSGGYGLRCDDCHDRALYCRDCCVEIHSRDPFHHITRWTGNHFEIMPLGTLGLRVQLGHTLGDKCKDPAFCDNFVVLDVTGIHEVTVAFCGCMSAVPHYAQLLRQRLFPASPTDPCRAATFHLLEHFHSFSTQFGVSALKYYQCLRRVTDNSGATLPGNFLSTFLIVTREWQHLKTMSVAVTGQGPDQQAVAPAPLGCAVDCPVCPRSTLNDGAVPSPKPSRLHRFLSMYSRIKVASTPVFASDDTRDNGKNCPHGFKRPCAGDDSADAARGDFPDTASHLSLSYTLDIGTPGCMKGGGDSELACGNGSWYKFAVFPASVLLKVFHAVPQRVMNTQTYEALTTIIPAEYVESWDNMMAMWEADRAEAPNPFTARYSHLTQDQVRNELSEDAGKLIIAELDLEEQQRQLRAAFSTPRHLSTDPGRIKLIEQERWLRSCIDAWHAAALGVVPGLTSLCDQSADLTSSLPTHDLPLLLPSLICSESTPNHLLEDEWRLREAQGYDCLADLRGHLEVLAYIRPYAAATPAQSEAGWCTNLMARTIRTVINMDVHRYYAAFAGLSRLGPILGKTGWQEHLRVLRASDVRYISDLDQAGEPSWIWRFGCTSHLRPEKRLDIDVNRDLRQALRIQWCEARAHALETTRRCESLNDDLARIIAHHQQRGQWWERQVGRDLDEHPDFLEGANAHACRQAVISRSVEDHCSRLWTLLDEWVSNGQSRSSSLHSFNAFSESLYSPTLGEADDSGWTSHGPRPGSAKVA